MVLVSSRSDGDAFVSLVYGHQGGGEGMDFSPQALKGVPLVATIPADSDQELLRNGKADNTSGGLGPPVGKKGGEKLLRIND